MLSRSGLSLGKRCYLLAARFTHIKRRTIFAGSLCTVLHTMTRAKAANYRRTPKPSALRFMITDHDSRLQRFNVPVLYPLLTLVRMSAEPSALFRFRLLSRSGRRLFCRARRLFLGWRRLFRRRSRFFRGRFCYRRWFFRSWFGGFPLFLFRLFLLHHFGGVDPFDKCNRSGVAPSLTESDDAGVAAVPAIGPRRDIIKQLLDRRLLSQHCQRCPSGVDRAILA